MQEWFIHRLLKLPYRLHSRVLRNPKNPIGTVVMLHGLGQSSVIWKNLAESLPHDLRIITVDLLGFGISPKPKKARYNINIQARSLAKTLLRLRINQKVVLLGHSMGSLVTVECIKRYPIAIKGAILCSPPFYSMKQKRTLLPENNKLLTDIYKYMVKNPEIVTKVAPHVARLKLTNEAFQLNSNNIEIYLNALESSIIQQNSYQDIMRISKPTYIIHGAFDPLVIQKNIRTISKQNPNVTKKTIPAGHEISKQYYKPIQQAIEIILSK